MTKNGGFAAFESADGRRVFYAKDPKKPGLWSVPSDGGEEMPVIESLPPAPWGNWCLGPGGIYYLDAVRNPGIRFLPFSGDKERRIGELKQPSLGDTGLAISPDGKWVLYSQVDLLGSDIIVAEGFR
jgi:hypothetical protein